MKVSNNLIKAVLLATRAHEGQYDKSNKQYIYHPLTVAQNVIEDGNNDENTVIAALLHDVAEDTDISLETLTNEFGEEVGEALKLLTHDMSVPYMDYVRMLKDNDIARAVKMGDLRHNMDLSRFEEVTPRDIERAEKYKEAYRILTE